MMQRSQHPPIIIHIGDQTLIADQEDLVLAIMDRMPPFVTDPTSPEARQWGYKRGLLCSTIRNFGPELIEMFTGERPPDIDRHEDPVVWFTAWMAAIVTTGLGKQEIPISARKDPENGAYYFERTTPEPAQA